MDSFEIGFLPSSFLHVPCVVNLSALINTKKEKLVKQSRFFLLLYTSLIIGTLRSEDRGENVASKVNSPCFNLHHDYSNSLTLSNVGDLSLRAEFVKS